MKRLPFTIKPYRCADRPRLKFCVRGKLNGKWSRHFFETETEAKTFQNLRNTELLQHGASASQVPPWLRFMAQRCQEQLAPFKKTLDDATGHYLRYLMEREKSCAPAKLFAEVVREKETSGFSRFYAQSIRRLGEKFCAWAGEKVISEISTREIDDFLTGLNQKCAASRNHLRILLNVAFEHARKRGYCSKNPVVDSIVAKEVSKPVGILTPDELARLLGAASPETLPALAISAFAGLRTAEVSRLDWKEIDLEGGFIEVTAENAKSSRRRIVKILPCLDAWLRPFEKKSGLVSGFCATAFCILRSKDSVRAGLTKWPKNALRHSFASYHIAHFKDAAALALQLGHAGTDLIFSNYREVVRPAKGEEYFKIMPGSRPETAKVRAFLPDAYEWSLRVFHCEDEFLSQKTELALYFGVHVEALRRWLKNPKAPAPREDGQFHVATWRAFVKEHTFCGDRNVIPGGKPFFTAPGETGMCPREKRVYFATKEEAQAYADRENSERLAKTIRLPGVENIVEFSAASVTGIEAKSATA